MPSAQIPKFTSDIINFAARLTSTLRDKFPDMLFDDVTPHHVFLSDLDAINVIKEHSIVYWETAFISGRSFLGPGPKGGLWPRS